MLGAGLAIAYWLKSGPSNTTRLRAELDGREYSVQELPNKQEAAERMAGLRQKLVKLRDHYQSEEGLLADPPVARFVERFRDDQMVENDMGDNGTSYSENKGEVIVVCLRDKTQPPHFPFVDENTLTFVVLHEMAHLMTESIGHTPEFWTNFRRILQDAIAVGIYQPQNYARAPVPYCGMMITDSPL